MSEKAERNSVHDIVFDMETDIRDITVLATMFNHYVSPAGQISESSHEALCFLTGQILGAASRTEQAYDRLFEASARERDKKG